ncbi:MAG: hypothetical protein HY329_08660 [Chloroflexi bacterium]|nr:hypothetical protein [Chloroflexota bacterium]
MSDGSPYLLTHTDLDGESCAIAVRVRFPRAKVVRCEIEEFSTKLERALSRPANRPLWISDLPLTSAQADRLSARGNVLLFDHHISNVRELGDRYPWAHLDTSRSAALIVYEYLLATYPEDERLPEYRDFFLRVDDYDRWIHAYPESKALNELMALVGADEFSGRFLRRASLRFTPAERSLLAVSERQREAYLEDAIARSVRARDQAGNTFRWVLAEQHRNELADRLLTDRNADPAVDYVLILNLQKCSGSFRSRGAVDVSKLAERFGGGGHPNAAGFTLTEDQRRYLGLLLEHL